MSGADSSLRDRMVFSVGAQRSGTFWLQRIITAHPAVSAVPSETALFSHGINQLFERFQHAARLSPQVGALYIERDQLIQATRSFCDAILTPYLDPGSRYLAERTATHVRHLALIAEIYPDARFIHIIRDGRDVARSTVAQPWGPDSVGFAAAEWRECIEMARDARLTPSRYREVRYEELLDDPEPTIAGLYEWLDLPATEVELDQALVEARREKNVDRYGRAGVAKAKWQGTFRRGDLIAFEHAAGDLASELGYPPAEPRGRKLEVARFLRRKASRMRQRIMRAARGIRPTGRQASPPGRRLALADRALAGLRAGRVDELVPLLAPEFRFGVVTPSAVEERRGRAALELLRQTIDEDRLLTARETLGQVHPRGSRIGYVLRFETASNRAGYRLVFITASAEQVTEISIYALPAP